MNKNLVIIATISALLAGTIVYAIMHVGANKESATGSDAANGSPPQRTMSAGGPADGTPGASRGASRARDREARTDAGLVARYGEARTTMSRMITGNIADMLDDAYVMGEMALDGPLGGMMGRGGPLNAIIRDLDLTDEQREQAQALFLASQRKDLEELKKSIDGMRSSPEDVMEIILASDAMARGEITEEEFKRIQEDAGSRVAGIINPLDRNNFRGGDPLGDTDFVSGMRSILDDGQNDQLQERIENRTAPEMSGIADIPVMDLEQLDGAINNGRKMTSGLRQMMEGMGGLQEIAPMLENR
jgi:Spy/CpxP family protein refolding chaperone